MAHPRQKGIGRRRPPNPRLAKIHRSYTVEEVASLYEKHKNTVRAWIKEGLPVCDNRRPTLILGQALRDFLTAKRTKYKKPCKSGELYCVRCREPRKPDAGMVVYRPVTATLGNLQTLCPICGSLMNRRITLTKAQLIQGEMDVRFMLALRHIGDPDKASVNCDFKQEGENHENAQS